MSTKFTRTIILFKRRLANRANRSYHLLKLSTERFNHPAVNNCLFLGSMYVGAEFTQQTLRHLVEPEKAKTAKILDAYDTDALKRYAVIGFGVFPHIFHLWYTWLDKRYPGRSVRTIATKLFLDQAVLGPVDIGLFYGSLGLLEGHDLDSISAEMREKFVPTFLTEISFWVPVQIVNFYFVSDRYRVMFIGAAGFVWINVLCIYKSFDLYKDWWYGRGKSEQYVDEQR